MSNENNEIEDTEDTEGHKLRMKVEEAGAEAEGHRLAGKKLSEAGDDDAEGHSLSRKMK